jgi:hypothetical protein
MLEWLDIVLVVRGLEQDSKEHSTESYVDMRAALAETIADEDDVVQRTTEQAGGNQGQQRKQ